MMAVGKDVHHLVDCALDVGDLVLVVLVVLMMEAGEAAKVGSHLI